MPRVTLLSDKDVITVPNPVEGLMVYCLSSSCGIEPGIYVFNGVKLNRMDYTNSSTHNRLIKNKIGVANVSFSGVNATNYYGGYATLFDGIDNTGGASFHMYRSSGVYSDWGFSMVLPNKYTIKGLVFDGRNYCCTNRINNVEVRLYRCGELVYSSMPITGAFSEKNTISIPSIYADEIKIIVPNGGNTGSGGIINFSELELIVQD